MCGDPAADVGASHSEVAPKGCFDGMIDELRISSTYRSNDYIETTYNNFNSPDTFYTLSDITAPGLSITALAPDPNSDTTPTVTGTATEESGSVSNVEYQVDGIGGAWTACDADDGAFDGSSEAFSCNVAPVLSDGSHTVYFRSTDDSSNITASGSEPSDSFTIDGNPPSLGVDSVDPDPGVDKKPKVTGTTEDTTSTIQSVEHQIDSLIGAWTACTATDGGFDGTLESFECEPGSDLSDGLHVMYIRVTDSVGNISYPGFDAFTVDTTAPQVIIPNLITDYDEGDSVEFEGVVGDDTSDVASVEYSFDQASWFSALPKDGSFDSGLESFLIALSDLESGDIIIYVRATDTAGNVLSGYTINLSVEVLVGDTDDTDDDTDQSDRSPAQQPEEEDQEELTQTGVGAVDLISVVSCFVLSAFAILYTEANSEYN